MLRSTKLNVSGTKNPEARPEANCNASNICRLVENGSIRVMTANATAASSSTLRAPNTAPSQIATGAISI